MRNILLIEPSYKNKYPPIGLMKIATYHRMLGDKVTFFKGDLKELVTDLLTKKCIEKLYNIDEKINWNACYENISQYLKNGKSLDYHEFPFSKSKYQLLLENAIIEQKKNFQSKAYEKEPLFDRVYVATLFTFYWKITVETINFAKTLVKNDSDVFVGGVSATLLYEDVVKETGIKSIKGLLNKPGMLDKNNKIIVDTLPLDYSILDEIEYKYPENNAYYGYMTRGCIRKCSFCAVPTLEPEYCEYVPMKEKIEEIKIKYGEQRNLLLLDNNVLASPRFPEIIQEIIDCGFGKNATYTEPNEYEIALRNLEKRLNDMAYIKKIFNLNLLLLSRLKGDIEQKIYNLLESYQLLDIHMANKENLLKVASEIFPLYTKYFRKRPKQRYVDFNQGVDARLFKEDKAHLLGKINIRPLRIAFDDWNDRKYYENAIRLSANAGIKNFSNYILYNYNKDEPKDFYQRLKLNIDLCKELDINIYSFPMKFHPITGKDRFNRNYLGKHWNRKYIRAVQAVLNAIKGKVGSGNADKGKEFFEKAFGKNEDEFFKILEMPETFILYRFFFEWLGDEKNYPISTNIWWQCWQKTFKHLNEKKTEELKKIIHDNRFTSIPKEYNNPKFSELLSFYTNHRDDVITQGTELYKLKREYDANPTRKLRRKR
ncbi:MAG: hypothetical protein LBH98_05890 [Chitinispirillales bacterium]|jgi:radical SAM superfamily enzyme YgiQ (UPF0313 family)|nr:hypothetical protein [Chitinispirillales bacterium]